MGEGVSSCSKPSVASNVSWMIPAPNNVKAHCLRVLGFSFVFGLSDSLPLGLSNMPRPAGQVGRVRLMERSTLATGLTLCPVATGVNSLAPGITVAFPLNHGPGLCLLSLTAIATNVVPVFMTNPVQVPVTNLVAKPEAEAVIQATGSVVNTFAPGIGSILALALGGLYHGYRQIRNRKVNEALVQGVETARAILTTTPQGQAADAQFVKWLMDHQKEAGVFTTVSGLVEQLSDNPAAKLTAQEIAQRVQQAQQQRTASQTAAAAG